MLLGILYLFLIIWSFLKTFSFFNVFWISSDNCSAVVFSIFNNGQLCAQISPWWVNGGVFFGLKEGVRPSPLQSAVLGPSTTTVRTRSALSAASLASFRWDLDSARVALCHRFFMKMVFGEACWADLFSLRMGSLPLQMMGSSCWLHLQLLLERSVWSTKDEDQPLILC